MVVIRLASPGGRKKYPFRQIVVTDKRSKRDSFIEKLGYFDPIKKQLYIDKVRYQQWVSKGAKPEPKSRVNQLFKQWVQQNKETTITLGHENPTT